MDSAQADKLLNFIAQRWPTIGIKKGGNPQEPMYSVWKKDLLKWPHAVVQPIIRAFNDGLLVPRKDALQWSDLLPRIEYSAGRGDPLGAFKWQNGDVIEVTGPVQGEKTTFIGVISRKDADNYAELTIPTKSCGRIYWLNGTSRAGDGVKLNDEDAREWVKQWIGKRSGEPMGFDVWRKRFGDEPLDMSKIPF